MYDILGYAHDHLGDSLDDILKSEELLKFECVYAMDSMGPISQ